MQGYWGHQKQRKPGNSRLHRAGSWSPGIWTRGKVRVTASRERRSIVHADIRTIHFKGWRLRNSRSSLVI